MAIKVLCIGAHNDEIMADMGGTAYQLHQKGCELLFLNLACLYNDDTLSRQEKEAYQQQEIASAEILGGTFMSIGDRDALLFLESKDMIEETARVIFDYRPDIVFIHTKADNHVEHREVATVSYKALCVAWVRGAKFKEVYAFETGMMQNADYFKPHFFVNVESAMERVDESLMQYNQNHAKGIHLCPFYQKRCSARGYAAGVDFAEGFRFVKFPTGSDDILLKKLLGDQFIWYGNGMYPAFADEYF